MINVYISSSNDVYTNVAIERYLFEHTNNDITLFLWQNNPCVVIGRNQNIYSEVNIEYAKKQNISLIRRFSGGGAVFQDLGNLNYTFYIKDDLALDHINELILKVFNGLGINAYFSGRNDLLVNEKKFSGIAYCNDFNKIMYHGTCLINTQVEQLVNVLKPHDYKLKSHSVASYKSRVINLKEIKDINSNDIINSFITSLKTIDEVTVIKDVKINDDIKNIIDILKNPNYLYNDCPSYSYSFDIKLNNANYHFDIKYQNGEISDVKLYSDDLDVDKINYYSSKLLHKKISLDELESYLVNL